MNCKSCNAPLWDKPARQPDDAWCSPECYLQSLEAKCPWQAGEVVRLSELLGRAKALLDQAVGGNPDWDTWSKVRSDLLADYEKDPGGSD